MRCPYCLSDLPKSAMTKDHVIAKSWYPQPSNSRVTVRACMSCNHTIGKLEQDLLLKLGMCIDGTGPAAAGVVDRVLRAYNPAYGKSDRDRKLRQRRREEIIRSLISIEGDPPKSTLPFTLSNIAKGSRSALTISANDLNRVIEKWVRGFHFHMLKDFIEPDDEIEIYHVSDDAAERAFGDIVKFGTVVRAGPGVAVLQVTKAEGGLRVTLYGFNIWDQFRAYAAVTQNAVKSNVGDASNTTS